jgi:hypothetical protein
MVVMVPQHFCWVSVDATADVEGGTQMVKDGSDWISARCDDSRMNWYELKCNGGTTFNCVVDVDCEGCCMNVLLNCGCVLSDA